MLCSLLSAIGGPKVEDLPKYPIYWPRVVFGCLNPATQNLEDCNILSHLFNLQQSFLVSSWCELMLFPKSPCG